MPSTPVRTTDFIEETSILELSLNAQHERNIFHMRRLPHHLDLNSEDDTRGKLQKAHYTESMKYE